MSRADPLGSNSVASRDEVDTGAPAAGKHQPHAAPTGRVSPPAWSPAELVARDPGRVVALLGPHLSDERRARIEQVLAARTRRVVPVLFDLYDPHNIGAILRSAEAFGAQELHVIEGQHHDCWPRRATQGADRWLSLHWHQAPGPCLEALRGRGYLICAAHMEGCTLAELRPRRPVALVVGNEHRGLPEALRREADLVFRIPMGGFSRSVNVSVATGIALQHLLALPARELGGPAALAEDERARLRAVWYVQACPQGQRILQAALASAP